jgi:uncharacterized protein (DUF2126 family)
VTGVQTCALPICDKEERAHEFAKELALRMPGTMILRSDGRLYPGEEKARWNIGLYRRTDGEPLWLGPPDPMLCDQYTTESPELENWAVAFSEALTEMRWSVSHEDDPEDDADKSDQAESDIDGSMKLFIKYTEDDCEKKCFTLSTAGIADGYVSPRIDIPAFDTPALFLAALDALARSAITAGLPTLIIGGEAPPTDEYHELTTVTPDPAVIEINSAPNASTEQFLWRSRQIYDCATAVGLTPYRLYFNGTVADSGGGGHITLGGPSPQNSPFILQPILVLRLIRFFNHHPALSYIFAHDFVGSSGISVRPDERGSDAFDELVLELELLAGRAELTADLVWQGLSHFLCDQAGNSHRAEINIEKLWNPFLKGRGRLGLVEFRALRMPQTPERATAEACLLRAIVTMLATTAYNEPLTDWGRSLHDRYALPFYLEQDLQAVFDKLHATGFGLGKPIEHVLRTDKFRLLAKVALPGHILEIRRALEFWPLLGDVASEEQGGTSRLIDSSTARVELRLKPAEQDANSPSHNAWPSISLHPSQIPLPMRLENDNAGTVKVYGLRYRRFVPSQGLHPSLGSQAPVTFQVSWDASDDAYLISLHEWEPRGEAYPGLPEDMADAELRRSQRVTIDKCAKGNSDLSITSRSEDAPSGIGEYCVDLRYSP